MTNSEQHDLEKLLKDNLSDKTANVPDFVWDNIEEELFPKKKRRGFFWLFFIGIGLITGLSAAYLFTGNSSEKNGQLSKNKLAIENDKSSAPVHKRVCTEDYSREKSISKNASEQSIQTAGNRPATSFMGKGRNSVSGVSAASSSSDKKTHENRTSIGKNNLNPLPDPIDNAGNTSSAGNLTDNGETNDNKTELTENNQPDKKESLETETNTETEKESETDEPETAVATDTLKNTSAAPDAVKPDEESGEKPTRFAVSVYGGTSMYDMAVFKDYFTSGQLSNRPFKSGGVEIGAGFSYKIKPKLGVYSNISFNRKNTSFNYNLAITQADYFQHYSVGELIPLGNIEDDGANSCFLAKNVSAEYQINSWLFSLGTTYQLLQWKKITLGADLRFSGNLNSKLQMNELTVIQIQPYENERFNYFKLGGGLLLDYRIRRNLSIGIAPMYHWQFNSDKQSFYKGKLTELVLPLSFTFHF